LGEIEAHNLAEPGDVLVLQGVDLISNMGGISATIGRRQGELGAIVDGAVRDIDCRCRLGKSLSAPVSNVTLPGRRITAFAGCCSKLSFRKGGARCPHGKRAPHRVWLTLIRS
jgi:hypothetical protein